MTGWGQDGPWSQRGRPRHELHRHHRRPPRPRARTRRARTSRPTCSATSAAARPTSSSASSPPCSRPGSAARARSSTPRSSTAPPTSTRWPRTFAALGAGHRAARVRPARRRHALLRPLRDRRRPAHERRRAGATVLRRAGTPASSSTSPTATTPPTSPAIRDALTARFKEKTQAEWCDDLRRHRRLRRPDPPARRGPAAPAPRGARHLRRARRASPSPPPRRASPARVPRSRMPPGRTRRPHPRRARRPGASRTSTPSWPAAPRSRPVARTEPMRPFLFLGTRAEDDVAQQEYDAVLAGTGLRPDELVRVRLEAAPLGWVELDDWSGIILGGGPFNVSDPDDTKSPVQRRVEAELRRPRRARGRGRPPLPRRLLRHRRARHPGRRQSWTGRTASPSARCPSG